MLIQTVPEPLMKAMDFLYRFADRLNFLVHLKIFPDNLLVRRRMNKSQMQVEWVLENLGQEEKFPEILPETLMV